MSRPRVTRLASGTYRVDNDEGGDLVYVAGSPGKEWAFWNGELFHVDSARAASAASGSRPQGQQSLRAPMPATVVKVLAKLGSVVKGGDALVVLEAMKMELVIRAPAEATVAAVHCHEQDFVQRDTVLIELA